MAWIGPIKVICEFDGEQYEVARVTPGKDTTPDQAMRETAKVMRRAARVMESTTKEFE